MISAIPHRKPCEEPGYEYPAGAEGTCGRVHEIRYCVFMLACWAVTIRIAHVFVGNADIAIGDTINSNGKLVETAGHGDGEVLWHKSCGLSKHRG